MFMCDPPGRSDAESLINYGSSVHDSNYILFHDQEPIHLDTHIPLFEDAVRRNRDLNQNTGATHQAIITSEYQSQAVEQVCSQFNWQHYYYFFHGWAALDWYRGYNKTFLIQPWADRVPTKTFIAPNRIIAGHRAHRLQMLYWIFKLDMMDNHISCPKTCPAENVSIHDAISPLLPQYPDIASVFAKPPLPLNFAGEVNHPMHSCWLSLFDECADSLLYLVTETVAQGQRQHLTEKIFKPIALGMPFMVVGTQGSLKYLRQYGFKTFDGLWDESYDNEPDTAVRIQMIAQTLKGLDCLSPLHKQDIFKAAHSIIEHNWNHFYNGGFETVLWSEFTTMLQNLRKDFS
jgi:hypothetical protein